MLKIFSPTGHINHIAAHKDLIPDMLLTTARASELVTESSVLLATGLTMSGALCRMPE